MKKRTLVKPERTKSKNCSLYRDELSGNSTCYLFAEGCYLFNQNCKH